MIRTGTYRNTNGDLVHVRRTATGYVVRHPDGRVETFGVRADGKGAPMRRNGRTVALKAVSA